MIPYWRVDGDEIVEGEAFGFESVWLKGENFKFAKLPAFVKALETMPTTFQDRTKELIIANLRLDNPFDLGKGIFYPPSDMYATLHKARNFNLLFMPMDRPDLYKAFLKVDENRPETALRFIKKYGTLGFGDHFKPQPFGRFGTDIEPWDYFRTQLHSFKHLLATYRILKEERSISGKALGSLYLAFHRQLSLGLRKVTPCLVSGHSDDNPSDKFLDIDPRFLAGYHCSTLISAIYLQFYLDITNPGGRLKQCGHCHNWFIVGTSASSGKGRRSDSKYCTRSCQNARMQARRRAREREGR